MLTDGQTDGQTEWGIAIALSQIGWLGAKNQSEKQNFFSVLDFSVFDMVLTNIWSMMGKIQMFILCFVPIFMAPLGALTFDLRRHFKI